MTEQTIRIETDGRGVATLTLSRPAKHNAMSAAMIAQLTDAAAKLGSDPAVRVVVLTGAGESFCAGGDLDWMKAQFAASRAERIAEARKLAMMLRALNEMPRPLFGRVQGSAYGGGVGLMAVCDMVVAAADARFGLTETRLGLIPATIGPYVMARIGEAGARRTFLSARIFSADDARALGLVAAVAPAVDLDSAVEAEIRSYLAAAPGAVAAAKGLVRALGPQIDTEMIEQSIARLADTWETAEAREGVQAFLDKRPPSWRAG